MKLFSKIFFATLCLSHLAQASSNQWNCTYNRWKQFQDDLGAAHFQQEPKMIILTLDTDSQQLQMHNLSNRMNLNLNAQINIVSTSGGNKMSVSADANQIDKNILFDFFMSSLEKSRTPLKQVRTNSNFIIKMQKWPEMIEDYQLTFYADVLSANGVVLKQRPVASLSCYLK